MLDLGLISAIALIVPTTLADPVISYFISSIAGLGLILIPPVSKVMPLPTMILGFFVFAAPEYCIIINLDSCALPLPTDKRQSIPIFFISFSPRIFVLITGKDFDSFLA